MHKILKPFLLILLFASGVSAETVPAPDNQDVRYTIQIPAGGLKKFLQWRHNRVPLISHHMGGPMAGYPENALETMDNALKYGPGLMEVDVTQLADGTLILLHDSSVDRTTTGTGKAREMSWSEIQELFLKDPSGQTTSFRVPRLETVLRWAKGRAILTLDIKPGTDFAAVAKAVELSGAQDYVVAIAYSIEQAKSFHVAAPEMPITVTIRTDKEILAVEASGIPSDLVVAWTGVTPLPPAHYRKLHGKGWRVIMGTLGRGPSAIDKQIAANDNNELYLSYFENGADIIATDRFWAVQEQIKNPNLYFFIQHDKRIAK